MGSRQKKLTKSRQLTEEEKRKLFDRVSKVVEPKSKAEKKWRRRMFLLPQEPIGARAG